MIVAGDVGGGIALVPIIRKLREGGHDVNAYAYRASVQVWEHAGIDFERLSEHPDISKLFISSPRVVVVGTTLGDDIEKRVILSARVRNIPSIAVLDFWSNYAERFSNERGDLEYIPDKIAVMDEVAFCEMAKIVDIDRLVITGQPTYDGVKNLKISKSTRDKIRKSFGVGGDGKLVLFASQPIESLYGSNLGYTEKTVIGLLIDALDKIDGNITLLIRPHPRESDDSYYASLKGKRVRIAISRDWNYRHQILASDLVTGISSALLIEACYLGNIVISIQPHLERDDFLPSNRGGWSYPVYFESELEPLIKNMLYNADTRKKALDNVAHLKYHDNATDNIVELINRVMGIW